MRSIFTIHATINCPDTPGITFSVVRRTEQGALLQCKVALMQLGYGVANYTLEVQNVQRQPCAWPASAAA